MKVEVLGSSSQKEAGATTESTTQPEVATLPREVAAALGAKAKDSANLAELTARAERFTKRHGRLLSIFSGDSSIKYTPSPSAQTFAFYPKEFKVEVPVSWFADEKHSDGELLFANYHELSHFADMRQNPQAFLDNFDRLEQKAGTLAREYLASHPDCQASRSAVTNFYYEQLHTLYNCLDDIYVNNLAISRSPNYRRGDGKADIASLYDKVGFKEPDLTKHPLHVQMAEALLRDEMVGDVFGASIVDERVKKAIDGKFLGKTIREIVSTELKPKQGILKDPAKRYEIIRNIIEPRYLSLLEVALNEAENNNSESQSGDQSSEGKEQSEEADQNGDNNGDNTNSTQTNGAGQASDANQPNQSQSGEAGEASESGSFNPFGQNGGTTPPNFLDGGPDENTIRAILDSFKEDDDVKKMSPEERTKHQAEKEKQAFDKAHGISKSARTESDRIKNEITRARREMRQFWKRLIGKSIEYREHRVSHQRRGRFDTRSFIEEYPNVVESQRHGNLRSLDVYSRNQTERLLVDQPETIDVTLLVDCSGSMDSKKVEAAKRTAALLMYSLKDFNDAIDQTRNKTHSKLRANTEVITFGSDYAEVKPFDRGRSRGANDASIIKSISEIDSNLGSTDDASPLADILARLSSEETARIKNRKLKKIVFEITDGSPDNPAATARGIQSLANEGVITIGFQIGDVSDPERTTFNAIWNNSSPNSEGIYVGEDIDKLPQKLLDALSKKLNNIII